MIDYGEINDEKNIGINWAAITPEAESLQGL